MSAPNHGFSVENVSRTPHDGEKLPKELVDEMQAIFGKHPGFRTSTNDPYDRDI